MSSIALAEGLLLLAVMRLTRWVGAQLKAEVKSDVGSGPALSFTETEP